MLDLLNEVRILEYTWRQRKLGSIKWFKKLNRTETGSLGQSYKTFRRLNKRQKL
jgi:hypothetical protein